MSSLFNPPLELQDLVDCCLRLTAFWEKKKKTKQPKTNMLLHTKDCILPFDFFFFFKGAFQYYQKCNWKIYWWSLSFCQGMSKQKVGIVASDACTLFDCCFYWKKQDTQLGLISPNFRHPESRNLHLSQLSRVFLQLLEKNRHWRRVIRLILKQTSKTSQISHILEVR